MKQFFARQKSVLFPIITAMILIGILIAVPTGYEDALIYQGTERAIGKVTKTDNAAIKTSGLVQSGSRAVRLKLRTEFLKGRL